MVNTKAFLVLGLGLGILGSAHALFPRGCERSGYGFDNGQLVMNPTGKQSFFMVQNTGNQSVQLQRLEHRDVFMSPPLTAKIDRENWAAFASDVSNFHFQCFVEDAENITPVDCSRYVEVCSYPRVRFALSNMGNYWVAFNKTQTQVINEAVAKGIYLKW